MIRRAQPDDLPLVMAGLRGLAADLGDPFRASESLIETALFGPMPIVRAQLALAGAQLRGLAYYSPMFSTMLGMAGCYVSDLWTAPDARGTGLGARLLGAVARDVRADWQAGFIKLAAYRDNAPALAFYERLGFERMEGEMALRIAGPALATLEDRG